jgi:sugar/nucleoside kinase (ribokinase family)
MSLREGIELGIASAACSLSEPGAAGGMRSAEEAMALYRKLR